MRKKKEEIERYENVQYVFSFVKDGPQCQHVEKGRCDRCANPLATQSTFQG